jgi:hypothetical protein
VIVTATNVPRLERAERFRDFFASIPLDVNPLVLTRDEVRRAAADPATVAHTALTEGRVLFERRAR